MNQCFPLLFDQFRAFGTYRASIFLPDLQLQFNFVVALHYQGKLHLTVYFCNIKENPVRNEFRLLCSPYRYC